jgi:hypothetical protein
LSEFRIINNTTGQPNITGTVTDLFPTTLCSGAYNPPVYPMTINAFTISQYNELLTLYLKRGDEITRLQAVVRNVAHYLIAKQDVDGLNPVEEALLLECERAMEGKE